MILNLNLLRVFYLVAKHKSMAKAAEILIVSPPAVSKQIKELEKIIGVNLFFREKKSLHLTKEGKELFRYCGSIFRNIEKLENYIEKVWNYKSSQLRIGCTQTPAKYLMPKLISKFKRSYPNIKIILDQGNTHEMIDALLNNKIELAIMRYIPNEKRIRVRSLQKVKLFLISAGKSKYIQKERIPVKDLSKYPLILPKEGSGIRDVILEYLSNFGICPNIVLESASVPLIRDLVANDEGLTFLEEYIVKEDIKSGLFKKISINEGLPFVEIGVGYLNKNFLSHYSWAFIKMLNQLVVN